MTTTTTATTTTRAGDAGSGSTQAAEGGGGGGGVPGTNSKLSSQNCPPQSGSSTTGFSKHVSTHVPKVKGPSGPVKIASNNVWP